MLSRNFLRASNMLKVNALNQTFKAASINPRFQPRAFSTEVGIADMPDVFKVNYTEEFDQGLNDEEKAAMKRFDIYRSNPNDPEDRPKYVSYYIDTN
jgi:hypothetical protein